MVQRRGWKFIAFLINGLCGTHAMYIYPRLHMPVDVQRGVHTYVGLHVCIYQ